MRTEQTRFKKLINPDFQFKFALNCLVPMLVMTTVFWITLETFFRKMIQAGKDQGLAANHEYFKLIHAQRIELLQLLIIFSLILVIIFFIWGLLYSHRIAGPLHKLKIWLDETKDISEARTKPVQFRKNDFFQEIPDSLNKFLKKE